MLTNILRALAAIVVVLLGATLIFQTAFTGDDMIDRRLEVTGFVVVAITFLFALIWRRRPAA